MNHQYWLISILLIVSLLYPASSTATVYLSPADFISNNFDEVPGAESLWIKDEQNRIAKKIFGHAYRGLRVRYWQKDSKTAWVMDEIGKERPITIGVVIDGGKIQKLVILAFRESRGGEVRHPFFTRQFSGLFMTNKMLLNKHIDGISGATLSVRAVSKVSRYALYLHSEVISKNLSLEMNTL